MAPDGLPLLRSLRTVFGFLWLPDTSMRLQGPRRVRAPRRGCRGSADRHHRRSSYRETGSRYRQPLWPHRRRVNAAGVLVAGALDRTPVAVLDQLIATNVRGAMLATRAALAQFREQGAGVIINVSSILGVVPNPVVPAYTMSKYAIRGLSLCLHHTPELRGVHVCTIVPGPLDTPLFDQAANYSGRGLRSVPPSSAPERAAAAVVSCMRRPRRQVVVGFTGWIVLVGSRVFPGSRSELSRSYSGRLVLRRDELAQTVGDVFEPHGVRRIDGGWRRNGTRRRLGAAFGRALAARP